MLIEYALDVSAEDAYAKKWAYKRNPAYYNFDSIGGDCTNFISQCLYAGGAVMNYTPDTGWYYNSINDRAPAWTSVEFLHRFLVNNKGAGPFGKVVPLWKVGRGDIIQLGDGERFYHSLLVVDIKNGVPFIAAHMNNAYGIPITLYSFKEARCINIIGARKYS